MSAPSNGNKKKLLTDFDVALLTDVLLFLPPCDWASFQLCARSCYKACTVDFLWHKAASLEPFRLSDKLTQMKLSSLSLSPSPSSSSSSVAYAPPRGGWRALLAGCFGHHPPQLSNYLSTPLPLPLPPAPASAAAVPATTGGGEVPPETTTTTQGSEPVAADSFTTLNKTVGAWRSIATATISNGLSSFLHPQLVDPTAPADLPISPEQLKSVLECTAATSVGTTRVAPTCFVVSAGDAVALDRINCFVAEIVGLPGSSSSSSAPPPSNFFQVEATRVPLQLPSANSSSSNNTLATLHLLDLFPRHNFRPSNSKAAHAFLLLSIDDDSLRSAINTTNNSSSSNRSNRSSRRQPSLSPAQQQMEAANAAERAHRAVETTRAVMELVYSVSSTVVIMKKQKNSRNKTDNTGDVNRGEQEEADDQHQQEVEEEDEEEEEETPAFLEAMLHLSASDHRIPAFTFPGHFPDTVFVLPEDPHQQQQQQQPNSQPRVRKLGDGAWQSFARTHLGLSRRHASSVSLFFATHSREGFTLFLSDFFSREEDEKLLLRSDFAISWNAAPGVAPGKGSSMLQITGGPDAGQGSEEALLHAGAGATPHEYILLVASAIRRCAASLNNSLHYSGASNNATTAAAGGLLQPRNNSSRSNNSSSSSSSNNTTVVQYWTPSLIMSWLRPPLTRVTDAFTRRMKEYDDAERGPMCSSAMMLPPPPETSSTSACAAAAAELDTQSQGSSSWSCPTGAGAATSAAGGGGPSAPSIGSSSKHAAAAAAGAGAAVELLPDVDTHRALIALSDASETASSHDGTGEGPDGETIIIEDEFHEQDVAMQRLLATFMEDEEFAARHLQQQRFAVSRGGDDDDDDEGDDDDDDDDDDSENNADHLQGEEEPDEDDDGSGTNQGIDISNNSNNDDPPNRPLHPTRNKPQQHRQQNMLFERVHGRVSAVPDPSVKVPMHTAEFWSSYGENAIKTFQIALEVARPYCPSSEFALSLADQIRDGIIEEATRRLWTDFADDSEKYCTQLVSIVMRHMRGNYCDANVFEYRREKNALKRWYSLVHDKIEEYLLKARGPRHMLVLSVFLSNTLVPEFVAACEADLQRQAKLQGGTIAASSNFGKASGCNFIHPADARQACSFLLKEIDGMLARCEGGMSNALLNDPRRVEFVRAARNTAVQFASEMDHLGNMRVAAVSEESDAFKRRLVGRTQAITISASPALPEPQSSAFPSPSSLPPPFPLPAAAAAAAAASAPSATVVEDQHSSLPSSSAASSSTSLSVADGGNNNVAGHGADDESTRTSAASSNAAASATAAVAASTAQQQQPQPQQQPQQQQQQQQPQQPSLLRSAVSLFRGILSSGNSTSGATASN